MWMYVPNTKSKQLFKVDSSQVQLYKYPLVYNKLYKVKLEGEVVEALLLSEAETEELFDNQSKTRHLKTRSQKALVDFSGTIGSKPSDSHEIKSSIPSQLMAKNMVVKKITLGDIQKPKKLLIEGIRCAESKPDTMKEIPKNSEPPIIIVNEIIQKNETKKRAFTSSINTELKKIKLSSEETHITRESQEIPSSTSIASEAIVKKEMLKIQKENLTRCQISGNLTTKDQPKENPKIVKTIVAVQSSSAKANCDVTQKCILMELQKLNDKVDIICEAVDSIENENIKSRGNIETEHEEIKDELKTLQTNWLQLKNTEHINYPHGYLRHSDQMRHCGKNIWISEHNWTVAVNAGIKSNSRFIKSIAVAIFGIETLRISRISGIESKKSSLTKPALDATKLAAIKIIYEFYLRTKKHLSGSDLTAELGKLTEHIRSKIHDLTRPPNRKKKRAKVTVATSNVTAADNSDENTDLDSIYVSDKDEKNASDTRENNESTDEEHGGEEDDEQDETDEEEDVNVV